MIMKANKQIGFIYKNNESIDKILKDGNVVFERGFLRERTSTTLPITFGGVGKDLKDYRVYGNTVQSKLPSGYTQVDYIESSGTQYIDTGINADYKLSLEIKLTDILNTQKHMGAMRNNGNGTYTRHHFQTKNSNVQGSVVYYVDTAYYNIKSTSEQTNPHIYNIDVYNNTLQYDNHEPITITRTDFNTQLNYWLFWRNRNEGSGQQDKGNFRIYYCKMYVENELVRDFIPCYRNSDNEVGLYDLVNNVFYTNLGTGSFTYGSVAPTPDAPIEMVSCGDRTKNLFDKNNANIINGYIQGNTGKIISGDSDLIAYIKCKPNTQYSFQRMQIRDNKGRFRIGTTQTIPIADMTVENFYYKGNSEYSANKLDGYTTGANAEYLLFYFSQISGMSQDEIDTILGSIQIEENSIVTSYEPYGYKIPVNVRSENLFDKDNINIEDNKYLTSDGSYSDNSNFKATDYIPIKSSIIYNLSPYRNYSAYECFYDENKTFISSIRISTINNTFTTPSNAKYIRLSVRKTDNDELMLVEGSTTPTKYIPYYNETTNIYLDEPLRKIGEYNDYIDFKNGKVVRQLGEVVLDGSENWVLANIYNNISQFDYSNNLIKIFSQYNNISLFANYFGTTDRWNNSWAKDNIAFHRVNQNTIRLQSSNFTTLTDFTTWLSSNNVTVDYVLKTPTEEDIELPNILTIDGNNTLNIETEITPSQVYIKYKSNE